MKGSFKFIITMAGLFAFLFVLQLRMPQKFVWEPSFLHDSEQPFGSKVFDSVFAQSLPRGYQVTKKTFLQLDEEHLHEKIAVLITTTDVNIGKVDAKHLMSILQRGGKVMVAASYEESHTLDSIFGVNYLIGPNFSISSLKYWKRKQHNSLYDSIYWSDRDKAYPPHIYKVYANSFFLLRVDSAKVPVTTLASSYSEYKEPVAVKMQWGKGEVYFLSTPLLFTNFGILDKHAVGYVFRMMSQISDLPVYRTEAYMKTTAMEEAEHSPLRELLKRPPLRYALYLVLLGVLLFMLFTARRRQRIIPVIEQPRNHSLEFVQLIGTLYYLRHDHADLVRKKFQYFADEVRRKSGVDVDGVNGDGEEFRLLAEKTGMTYEYLEHVIREIRLVLHSEKNIPVAKMREMIDAMNKILSQL